MVYAGLGYLIQTDWRMLSVACSLVGFPILAIFLVIPESPRWLFANGKSEDGLKVLKRLTRSTNDFTSRHISESGGKAGTLWGDHRDDALEAADGGYSSFFMVETDTFNATVSELCFYTEIYGLLQVCQLGGLLRLDPLVSVFWK